MSPPGSAPQSKPLEELSELYASAADAQEAAAASSDPALARERLQAVLRDLAGAASFPAITGEHLRIPPFPRVCCQLSPAAAAAAVGSGFAESQPRATVAIKKHRPRSWSVTTPRATNGFIKTATK